MDERVAVGVGVGVGVEDEGVMGASTTSQARSAAIRTPVYVSNPNFLFCLYVGTVGRSGRERERVRTGYFRSTGGDNTGGSCLSDCKPVRWLALADEISRAA